MKFHGQARSWDLAPKNPPEPSYSCAVNAISREEPDIKFIVTVERTKLFLDLHFIATNVAAEDNRVERSMRRDYDNRFNQ